MSAEIPHAFDERLIEKQVREILSRHGTIQSLKVSATGEQVSVSALLRPPNQESEGEMDAYRAAQPQQEAEPEQSTRKDLARRAFSRLRDIVSKRMS